MIEQVTDVLDLQVGSRVDHGRLGLRRVVPLTHEHGRQVLSQHAFHRRQQQRLVVDHHVVSRRIASAHRIE